MFVRVLTLCLLLVGTGAIAARNVTLTAHAASIIQELPYQEMLVGQQPTLTRAGFELTPVARFEVTGRVLGRLVYESDTVAELSPVDIAIGWGPMSDRRVLAQIEMSQGERFFYWQTARAPLPRTAIEQSSTNVHTIPATPEIERKLRMVQPDDVVHLAGVLVNAYRPTDGYRWTTSLVRDDTGDGACEIVYVTDIEIAPAQPRGTYVQHASAE
ncbi:MAG TPA: hypothetical protein VKZ48_04855 [Burkholderiales bacterium]|nr:hypothetical protein [Burkholderiales bacterium]